MPRETITGTGRTCWASYLINGDDSGVTEEDRADADEFANYLGGSIVGVGEDSWFGTPDTGGLAGDVCEYTALVEE